MRDAWPVKRARARYHQDRQKNIVPSGFDVLLVNGRSTCVVVSRSTLSTSPLDRLTPGRRRSWRAKAPKVPRNPSSNEICRATGLARRPPS